MHHGLGVNEHAACHLHPLALPGCHPLARQAFPVSIVFSRAEKCADRRINMDLLLDLIVASIINIGCDFISRIASEVCIDIEIIIFLGSRAEPAYFAIRH